MNVLKHMIRFRRANGDDVEDYKQPDMYAYQHEDGVIKIQKRSDGNWYNPAYWVKTHGKIICKFKVYRK